MARDLSRHRPDNMTIAIQACVPQGQIFDLPQALLQPGEVSHAGGTMRSGPLVAAPAVRDHAVVIIGAVRGAQQGGA